jgi:hypothetical protein
MNLKAEKKISTLPHINVSHGLAVNTTDVKNITYIEFVYRGTDFSSGVSYALHNNANVLENYIKNKKVKVNRISNTALSVLTDDFERLFLK